MHVGIGMHLGGTAAREISHDCTDRQVDYPKHKLLVVSTREAASQQKVEDRCKHSHLQQILNKALIKVFTSQVRVTLDNQCLGYALPNLQD